MRDATCPRCQGKGKIEYTDDLAGMLHMLREEHGLSYRELSKATGISAAHLHHMEAGKSENPTFETMTNLAMFYGMSLDDMAKAIKE